MRNALLPLVAVSICLLSGCDMLRKLAGRPTGEEIEQMRIEMLMEEQRVLQARKDSIETRRREVADSLALLDSMANFKGAVLNVADVGGLAAPLDAGYYVIVGAFKSRSNAEVLSSEVAGCGIEPLVLNFRNGFTAIAVFPSDNLADTFRAIRKVRAEPFCPKDVWVLINE